MQMFGSGGFASARGGTLPGAKRQPLQIGFSGSPASNSTQTPAPGGGTMYTPIGGPVGPASGAHGSHQPDGVGPRTAGTRQIMRPRNSGSAFSVTVPLYFP